ncbi:hypothetical protein D2E33_07135 [Mycobacteroides abscessus]|nr:hypothetical protein D2E33_07135 [Mycobacteroides abscessus]RIT70699.1 hypothetical protein D2E87_09880 [Mycobacteroides abscessus]
MFPVAKRGGVLPIGSDKTVPLFGERSAEPAANCVMIIEFVVDDHAIGQSHVDLSGSRRESRQTVHPGRRSRSEVNSAHDLSPVPSGPSVNRREAM